MILKTYDDNLGGILDKIGFSKRSFAEWGKQVSTSFNEAEGGVNKVKNALKTMFTVQKEVQDNFRRTMSGDIVTKENIDSYIPELSTKSARKELDRLQKTQKEINATKGSWDDYNDNFKDGREYLLKYAKSHNVLESSVDDVKVANNEARESVIAHNKELEQQTLKAKASQLVMGLLSTAMNALVSIIITKVIQGFVDMANAQENAIKKADEFINKFEEMRNELSSNKKTIDDISADYERLSKGVDTLGRNISLNTEEYSEYNDIVNQIADMFPQMISGYTEEGNAIIAHKGNVEALTKAYEEQKKAAQDAIIVGSADVFKGYKSKIDYKAGWIWEENGLLQMKKYAEELSAIIDDTEAVAVFWENQRNNRNGGNNLLQKDFLDYANIDVGHHTSEYDYVEILQENKPKILSAIRQLTTEINTETAKIKPIMSAFMEQSWDYQTLDSDVQDVVKQIVNQFDSEFYAQFNNENEMASWITDNIVDKFKGVEGKKLSSEIELMFGVQTQFNNNEITVSEYQNKLSAFLALIEPLDDKTEKAIKLLFDIEVDENGNSNSTTSTLIKNVENKLKDEFDGKVGELTLGDLQIAANNISVPDGVNLTWDDLLARIEAFKTASQKTTLSGLITESKELQNSFDDTFSNQSTIQSAFDKIQEGTSLSADEVRELKTLCPQLNNAFEQVADGWTISSEDLVNANENVTRSAKTSIQNQIELLKQIKKPTSVNSKSDWEQYDSWRQAQQEIAGLELILSMFGLTAKDTDDYLEELDKTIETLTGKTKTLSSALQEQDENGTLSAETIMDIVDAGYASCLVFDEVTGKVTLNKEAYIALAKAEYDEQIASLEAQITMLKTSETMSDLFTNMSNGTGVVFGMATAFLEFAKSTTTSSEKLEELEGRLAALKTAQAGVGTYDGDTDSSDPIKAAFDKRIKDLKKLADKALNGDLPEEVDYTDPLDKFGVARDYYDDAITECQNRLNELVNSGKEDIQDEVDSINDTIDDLKGNLKSLKNEEFEVKISTWEENNNYNENDVAFRNNRSNYVKSLIAETYGENSEEYQKFMKENAEFDEETWKIRTENEKTYWENLKQEVIDYYDKEIEKLREIADEEERISKEKELQNNLIKAQQRLEDAKKNRNQLIFRNGTFEYVENQEEVRSATEEINNSQKAIDEYNREKEIEYWEKRKEQDEDFYDALLLKINNYIDSLDGNVLPTSSDSEVISKAGATDEANKAQNAYDSLGKDGKSDVSTEVKTDTVVVEQTGQPTSDNAGIQGTKQLYTIDEAAKILADRLGVSVDSDVWKNFATSVVSNSNPQSSPLSGIQNQNVYNNSTVNNNQSLSVHIDKIECPEGTTPQQVQALIDGFGMEVIGHLRSLRSKFN